MIYWEFFVNIWIKPKGGGEGGCGMDDFAGVPVALLCVLVWFDMIEHLKSDHLNHIISYQKSQPSYSDMIVHDLFKFDDLQVSLPYLTTVHVSSSLLL